jgi:hypothetical protein
MTIADLAWSAVGAHDHRIGLNIGHFAMPGAAALDLARRRGRLASRGTRRGRRLRGGSIGDAGRRRQGAGEKDGKPTAARLCPHRFRPQAAPFVTTEKGTRP